MLIQILERRVVCMLGQLLWKEDMKDLINENLLIR